MEIQSEKNRPLSASATIVAVPRSERDLTVTLILLREGGGIFGGGVEGGMEEGGYSRRGTS